MHMNHKSALASSKLRSELIVSTNNIVTITNLDKNNQFLLTYDSTVRNGLPIIKRSFQNASRLLMGLKKLPKETATELRRHRQLAASNKLDINNNRENFSSIQCCRLSISIDELMKPNHTHKLQFVQGKIAAVFGGFQSVTIVMQPYQSTIQVNHPYKYIIFVVINQPVKPYRQFEDPVDYIQDVKTRYRIGGNIGVIEPSFEFDSIGRKVIKGFKSHSTTGHIQQW
ncbi:hypothetical protein HDU76_006997 [Blyttiomyces sp. JEL0837]|nr:hypothetical protein HDU76_006997 [Blyttiomyces sp. JEL0837]